MIGLTGISGIGDDTVSWLQQESLPGIPNGGLVIAGLVLYWLVTPHGEDYQREKRQLRKKHSGYARVSRYLSVDSGHSSGSGHKSKGSRRYSEDY